MQGNISVAIPSLSSSGSNMTLIPFFEMLCHLEDDQEAHEIPKLNSLSTPAPVASRTLLHWLHMTPGFPVLPSATCSSASSIQLHAFHPNLSTSTFQNKSLATTQ
jgi:hypothetical protein